MKRRVFNRIVINKGANVALIFLSATLCTVIGCTKAPKGGPMTLEEQIQRGKAIYNTNCISCHNTDPNVAGSLGPEVYGSSLELLELRIVKGQYPADYTPKRPTSVMPTLPQLAGEVAAIHAYLNAK